MYEMQILYNILYFYWAREIATKATARKLDAKRVIDERRTINNEYILEVAALDFPGQVSKNHNFFGRKKLFVFFFIWRALPVKIFK